MKESIQNAVNGVLRIGQTVGVLASTGLSWATGDRPPPPRLLRQTFERLGATYVKLGQFIASSPTFFPPDYVEEFQYCLDQTRPLSFTVIQGILEDEFKDSLNSVFEHIDHVPLASASIAQVHAAKLVTGEDVVIKVQKPGVRNVLVTDLNFLYAGARILEILAPKLSWTSLSGVVEEIQRTMVEECDFYQEGRNLDEFRDFLRESGNNDVVVPKHYPQASTMKVLTMERFYGVPLTDLETIRTYCSDPERTLITAMNAWFSSLTQCDFFHADVHAGNLMVLRDGRIGFIDFGIVGRIPTGAWQAISDFITATMMMHFDDMANAMIRIGITRSEVDEAALAADIRRLYSKMDKMVPDAESQIQYTDTLNESEEINTILMDLVKTGESHGLHFPREFALLIKQFLYFDRYIHLLAPDLDMFMDDRLSLLQ